jgi:hypothetical protein
MAKASGGSGRGGGGGGGASLARAAASGKLSVTQAAALRKLDGAWHTLPTEGSQSTPRAVRINFYERGQTQRMYVNSKVLSRKPREGTVGYIDLRTGEISGPATQIAAALRTISRGRETWAPYR